MLVEWNATDWILNRQGISSMESQLHRKRKEKTFKVFRFRDQKVSNNEVDYVDTCKDV